MARPRNPRRIAHEVLRAMNNNITAMCAEWSGPRKGVNPDSGRFERSPAESQPENCVEDWERLVDFMLTVEHQAGKVRRYAENRATALRSRPTNPEEDA